MPNDRHLFHRLGSSFFATQFFERFQEIHGKEIIFQNMEPAWAVSRFTADGYRK